MAHIAVHAPAKFSLAKFSLSRAVAHMFTSLGNVFVALANANSRVRQVEFLQSLSDADLAKRGLKREDIAQYVFRDMYYV